MQPVGNQGFNSGSPHQQQQLVSPALQAALGGMGSSSPNQPNSSPSGITPPTAPATKWRASVSPGLLASMSGMSMNSSAPMQIPNAQQQAAGGSASHYASTMSGSPQVYGNPMTFSTTTATTGQQQHQMYGSTPTGQMQPQQPVLMQIQPQMVFSAQPTQPQPQQAQQQPAQMFVQPMQPQQQVQSQQHHANYLQFDATYNAAGQRSQAQQPQQPQQQQMSRFQLEATYYAPGQRTQSTEAVYAAISPPQGNYAATGPASTPTVAAPAPANEQMNTQMRVQSTYGVFGTDTYSGPPPPSSNPPPPRVPVGPEPTYANIGNSPDMAAGAPASPFQPQSPLGRAAAGSVSRALSKQDAKRQNVMLEMVETERNYVSYLRYVIDKCIIPSRQNKILTEVQIKQVFSNFESLTELHAIFLKELDIRLRTWTPDTCIGDIFLRYVNAFNVYQEFINNFEQSRNTLSQLLKRNAQFVAIENGMMNDPTFRKLTLGAYLIMPIQRIPRYVLLLDDLFRHTESGHADYDSLKNAAARFKSLSQTINTRKGEAELIQRAFEIDKQLTLPDGKKLLKPDRRFVEEREVTLIGGSGSQQVVCFFFNDCIFLARRKEKSSKGFIFMGRLKIRDIKVQAVGITEAKQRMKRFEALAGKPIELPRTQAFLIISTADDEEFLIALNSEQDQTSWTTKVEVLRKDMQQSCWRKLDLQREPHPRFWHSFVPLSSTKFVIFGGQYTEWTSRGNPVWLDDAWSFDTQASSWEQFNLLQKFALAEHSSVMFDGKLLVYGGHNFGEYSPRLYSIDLQSGTVVERAASGTSPAARSRHSCVVIDRKLYVFGGSIHGASSRMDNELYEYDLDSNFWNIVQLRTPTRPAVRYGHAAVAFKGYLYIFGGRNSTQDLNDMYIYDPNQQMWFQNVEMSGFIPSPRQAMSVSVVHDRGFMLMFGGESATQVYNDLFAFNFEANVWSRILLPIPLLPRMAFGMHLVVENPTLQQQQQIEQSESRDSPYSVLSHSTLYIFGGRVQKDDGSKIPTSEVISLSLSDRWLQSVPDLDKIEPGRPRQPLEMWQQMRSRDSDKLNVKLSAFDVRTTICVPTFLFHMKNISPAFNWDGVPSTLTFHAQLGSGTYGDTYLVSYDNVFAVCKVIKLKQALAQHNPAQFESKLLNLTNQIILLSRCSNAALAQYYGSVLAEPYTLWILSEYIPAGSVKELIKTTSATERLVSTVAAQSLLGLSYLHTHGIVARSMKASNVMVSAQGDVKLTDYGINHLLDDITEAKFLNEFSGSFVAPETQTSGSFTPKADVWQLGITLIEIAENTPPFKSLLKAKKWSTEMTEFITLCLSNAQMKRPDALNILLHPFLDSARSSSVVEMCAIRRHLASKPASENSNATTSQNKTNADSSVMAGAVRQLVRRYREELFREIPLSVAETVDRKFEDLEAELLLLLDKSRAGSGSPGANNERASMYFASKNPLTSEPSRASMFFRSGPKLGSTPPQ